MCLRSYRKDLDEKDLMEDTICVLGLLIWLCITQGIPFFLLLGDFEGLAKGDSPLVIVQRLSPKNPGRAEKRIPSPTESEVFPRHQLLLFSVVQKSFRLHSL
jgi:hypothetical protein